MEDDYYEVHRSNVGIVAATRKEISLASVKIATLIRTAALDTVVYE